MKEVSIVYYLKLAALKLYTPYYVELSIFWGGGWFESRVFLKSIHRALLTLNPYRSNFKPISKRRTHPSYQMIKSIIFVGCVRIYCCKDFNVCPQAAISKNKSDKILKNTSPAVNKITFVMRAAFLERTICKVLNSSVLKRGWVENLDMERTLYSEGNKVNFHIKCYLIDLILKVRVFRNQKVANIGSKWPTKYLKGNKNSF